MVSGFDRPGEIAFYLVCSAILLRFALAAPKAYRQWQLRRLSKQRRGDAVQFPPPQDQRLKFPDPSNKDVLDYLATGATVPTHEGDAAWLADGYVLHCHPDLRDFLYELIHEDGVVRDSAFGLPVLATAQRLIFAWAGGTDRVLMRLSPSQLEAVRKDGGRYDPTYGNDWIVFRFGGVTGGPQDWRGAMEKWIAVSYRQAKG